MAGCPRQRCFCHLAKPPDALRQFDAGVGQVRWTSVIAWVDLFCSRKGGGLFHFENIP